MSDGSSWIARSPELANHKIAPRARSEKSPLRREALPEPGPRRNPYALPFAVRRAANIGSLSASFFSGSSEIPRSGQIRIHLARAALVPTRQRPSTGPGGFAEASARRMGGPDSPEGARELLSVKYVTSAAPLTRPRPLQSQKSEYQGQAPIRPTYWSLIPFWRGQGIFFWPLFPDRASGSSRPMASRAKVLPCWAALRAHFSAAAASFSTPWPSK